MNINQDLNDIFNLGLLIGFAGIWIFHVLYFWVPLFVPSCHSNIKLKDSELNAISSFTIEVGVGLIIGLGVISSLSSNGSDVIGYIYALISILAFCIIWRYVKGREVENG